MADTLQDIVAMEELVVRSLQAADRQYHRLVLLVGKSGSGKTRVLQAVAERLALTVVNINLELSRALLELTEKQRMLRVRTVFDDILRQRGSPVLLDNIEILFDKTLRQDPLRLLRGVSRHRTVAATWNGTFAGGRLVYAEAGHDEHRDDDPEDTLIVGMDGVATIG
jgi:ABC-type uncharacterized transport system ATPase component